MNHKHLKVVFLLHDKLIDLTENINDFFALTVAIHITVTYVMLLFGVFFMAKVLFWNSERSVHMILYSLNFIFWSLNGCFVLYLLLFFCETTRENIFHSSTYIYDLTQSDAEFLVDNDHYYHQLKAFTIQLLHRKKVFTFSAVGLFNLDFTFIFSVCNATKKICYFL